MAIVFRFKELRFQFGLCAKPHPLGASGVEWEEIGPPDAVEELSNRFEAVRAIALQIRQNTKRWEEEFQAAQAVALNNLRACGGSFRDSVMVVRLIFQRIYFVVLIVRNVLEVPVVVWCNKIPCSSVAALLNG